MTKTPDMKAQKTEIEADRASQTRGRCSSTRARTALRMMTIGPAKTSVATPVTTSGTEAASRLKLSGRLVTSR